MSHLGWKLKKCQRLWTTNCCSWCLCPTTTALSQSRQTLERCCTTSPRASTCLAGHASSAAEEDGKNKLREAVGSRGNGVQAVDYIVWRASLIWLLRTQARKQEIMRSGPALAMKASWKTLCQSHTFSPTHQLTQRGGRYIGYVHILHLFVKIIKERGGESLQIRFLLLAIFL